jgi:SPP1 family predicted phage head-tail adaptor
MPPIPTGQREHRIEFLKPIAGEVDAYNEPKITYEPFGQAWAAIEDLSGSELLRAQEVQSEISVRVTVLFLDAPIGLANTWRIQTRVGLPGGPRILELASPPIDPDGRRRELQLLCKEAKNVDAIAQGEADVATAAAVGSGGGGS